MVFETSLPNTAPWQGIIYLVSLVWYETTKAPSKDETLYSSKDLCDKLADYCVIVETHE